LQYGNTRLQIGRLPHDRPMVALIITRSPVYSQPYFDRVLIIVQLSYIIPSHPPTLQILYPHSPSSPANMFSSAIRTAMLQARDIPKTTSKSTLTDVTAPDTKVDHPNCRDMHGLIEGKQFPTTTAADTSARVAWQRYRDEEAHQIWLSSPRKEFFQTKPSTPEPRCLEPTPAMTFQKDREMHIATRRVSVTEMRGKNESGRRSVETRLGGTRETKSLRSRWLSTLLGGNGRT
jgi:hypothetical protein